MGKLTNMDCNVKGHWLAFWICLVVAIFLMIGGAIVPPPFVVDSSIFKCVAWLFGFAALSQVPAIVESGKTASIKHNNTVLTIGDTPDAEQEAVDENDEVS